MKDQYSGDVGDFSKFALLLDWQRAHDDQSAGILWYRTPNETRIGGAQDGRFIDYPELEGLDPGLYARLQKIARGRPRRVSDFQRLGLTKGMAEFGDLLDSSSVAPSSRIELRQDWFRDALRATAECQLVLLDPDNGIRADNGGDHMRRRDKFALESEIRALHARGQSVVCYQHATRSQPFDDLLRTLAARYPGSFTLRWRRRQARAYLVWPAGSNKLRAWAKGFLLKWWDHFTPGPGNPPVAFPSPS